MVLLLGAVCGASAVADDWLITGDFGRFEGAAKKSANGIAAADKGLEVVSTIETDGGVTHRTTVVKNVSDRTLTLNCLMDVLGFDGVECEVYTQCNAWQNESMGAWAKLNTTIGVRNPSLRTDSGAAPVIAVRDLQTGRGRVYHLLTDSGWEMTATRYSQDGDRYEIRVDVGMDPRQLCWKLAPGESVALPEVLYHDFCNRLDLDAWKLHAWWNRHFPGRAPATIYNSWMCRFDKLKLDFVLRQVEKAAELGLEYFVIDAGWYGTKDGWWKVRGDWAESPDGHLGGRLAEVSAAVRKAGMKFGFWIESECADNGAEVYRTHPEWFLDIDGRHFLDFRKRAAFDYIVGTTVALVKKYEASFLKQDFNQNAPFDPSGRDFTDYNRCYREYIAAVRERCPGIYIEGCASGGGRMDLGNARSFDGFWLSDNQSPFEGLRIVKETMLRLPPRLIERWIVARSVENVQPDYNGKDNRLLACDDALWRRMVGVTHGYLGAFTAAGPKCFSCDLTAFSRTDFAELKKLVAVHRGDAEFWQKAVGRILVDTPEVTVFEYSDEELDDVRLFVATNLARQRSLKVYPVVGEGNYTDGTSTRSASEIREHGIVIAMPVNHDGTMLRLRRIR